MAHGVGPFYCALPVIRLRTLLLAVILLPLLLGGFSMDLAAQRDRSQNPKGQREHQIKQEREREKQKESAFRDGRKAHWKKQERSTRKRWRAQRRQAKRQRRTGRSEGWLASIFKPQRPIPWTRRAANKVGNLFKGKRKRRSY